MESFGEDVERELTRRDGFDDGFKVA